MNISHNIWPKVTVHKGAETIQGRKLYEEIRYVFATYSPDIYKICVPVICQHWRNLICWENTSEYGFQHDGTVQLFGTKGQKFHHWSRDKLKILPRDRMGWDSQNPGRAETAKIQDRTGNKMEQSRDQLNWSLTILTKLFFNNLFSFG